MWLRITAVLLATMFPAITVSGQAHPALVGRSAPDFVLPDTAGKTHALRDYRGRFVVVGFLGVKCPISAAYSQRINAIASQYAASGVVFLGINSNANESIGEIRENAAKAKYPFAVLKDTSNVVADLYGATVTPEVYVIDKEGVLRYHGRVDNASDPARVERQDLRLALDETIRGATPGKPELKAFGCQIIRISGSAVAKTTSMPVQVQGSVTMLKPADFDRLKAQSLGKVVLINFWATWCAPCVAEFPEFIKINEDYKSRGVRFISISTDELSDIQGAVIPFLKKQKAEFEVFVSAAGDPQDLIDVVDKNWSGALPATFVFDKQGRLIFTKYGIIDRDELLKVLDASIK